jgi:hypothetical protein
MVRRRRDTRTIASWLLALRLVRLSMALFPVMVVPGCTPLPPPLDGLEQELGRYRFFDDLPGEDRWSSAQAFVRNGGGDCEDWAAFSYRWLADHRLGPKLVVGTNGNGVAHAWVEVDVGGATWFVNNQHVSWRRPPFKPLAQNLMAALVILRFGPDWPNGIGDTGDEFAGP